MDASKRSGLSAMWAIDRAREMSSGKYPLIVALLSPSGAWEFREYISPAQARAVFNREQVGHSGFEKSRPVFLAHRGVIMAWRTINRPIITPEELK